jgi:hypothetical protein
VFRTSASHEAEAARRTGATVRVAGAEVPFDVDGGLEHGDEGVAKIRRSTKQCVLFILLISSNTQARYEGYCRLEGALATERAMNIAPADASIGPIIMGATREPAALVPDRFRAGPWTRLPGGEVTPEVRARFLTPWSHRAGAVVAESEVARVSRPVSPNDTGEEPRATPKVGRALRARRLWATADLLVVLGAGGCLGVGVCIAHRAADPGRSTKKAEGSLRGSKISAASPRSISPGG